MLAASSPTPVLYPAPWPACNLGTGTSEGADLAFHWRGEALKTWKGSISMYIWGFVGPPRRDFWISNASACNLRLTGHCLTLSMSSVLTLYAMRYPFLNYKERCEIMNILPLSFRREMADIKLLYKSMYTTLCSNNVSELVKTYIPNPRLRSNRKGLLLQPQQLRTETYKGFFTNRIVTIRNQLPPTFRVDQSAFSTFVNELNFFLF